MINTDYKTEIALARKVIKNQDFFHQFSSKAAISTMGVLQPASRMVQSMIYFCSSLVRTFILGVRFGRS
jgi:hypothetical protein